MRKDMPRLLLDAGKLKDRWGGNKRRNVRPQAYDEDYTPDKREYRKERSQADYLSPFWRWLDAQVGRRFNDVHSELCEVADSRTLQGHHLRQHFGNKWRDSLNGGIVSPKGVYDVVDGVLVKTRHRRLSWSWEKPADDTVLVKDGVTYRKLKGIWYRTWIETTYRPRFVTLRDENNQAIDRRLDHANLVPVHTEKKKQLSRRELRALNVTNDQ